jgi:arginyl-tRNA synthetase
MNLIEMELKNKIYDACVSVFELELDRDLVMVEMPRDPSLGDYSTNIAMRLTKVLRQNPRLIAEKIVASLKENLSIAESIEIANPGFINFRLRKSCMADIINVVLDKDEHYG